MKDDAYDLGYKVMLEYKKSGGLLKIHVSDVSTGSRDKVLALLHKMKKDFPEFINSYEEDILISWVESLDKRLPRGNGDFQTIYNWVELKDKHFSICLWCSLASTLTPKCYVRVDETI